MRVSSIVAAVLMAAALPGAAAHAADDGSERAFARAQALLRQVSAQKQELETANARLTAEVNKLQKNLTHVEGDLKQASLDLQSQQRKAEHAGGTLEATRGRLERTENRLREAIERLRTAKTDLQQLHLEKADLTAKLVAVEAGLADSERKNLQLYEANVELLELYRKKGPLTALIQREPVTGIANVGIENTLLEYQTRLEASLRDANRDGAKPDSRTASPEAEDSSR